MGAVSHIEKERLQTFNFSVVHNTTGKLPIADEDMADKLLNKRGVNGRKLFKQVTVKAKPKSERRDDATVGEAVDAMHQLDDSEENYTEDGLPDTRVLSEIIGRHVSADTRDKAFEVFQEEEDDEDNADSEQVEV